MLAFPLSRSGLAKFRPLHRPFSQKIISQDKQTKPYRKSNSPAGTVSCTSETFPTKCDVAIIGGGGMGSSTAYFLKKKAGHDLNVVVVERDSAYKKASTPLSAGCLRQQFTVEENVLMSRFAAEFLHSFRTEIGDEVDPNFKSYGNLYMVDEKNAERLAQGVALQKQLGVKSDLLSNDQLKEKFPWINPVGVGLASYGCVDEGWFDPWALLTGLRKKAQALGAVYVDGEVIDFEFKSKDGVEYDAVDRIVVRTGKNEERTIEFDKCLLSAGAFSGELAKKARIGTGAGLLTTPLPVEPKKRYIYVINSQGQNGPPLTGPQVRDTSQVYFRPEGPNFITSRSPPDDREPSVDNLDVDLDFFDTDIWPHLAYRFPAFESLKMVGSWAGYYDQNTFDQNGVIGKHPAYDNFYIAAGFSGHGIQKVPAVGRGMAELIVDGRFKSIDLSIFGFERLIERRPVQELAIA